MHKLVEQFNFMQDDLATVARFMTRFKKQYNDWLHYVAPALITFLRRLSQKFGDIGNYSYFCNVKYKNEDGNRKTIMERVRRGHWLCGLPPGICIESEDC